jgi:hypothetical protein
MLFIFLSSSWFSAFTVASASGFVPEAAPVVRETRLRGGQGSGAPQGQQSQVRSK